jgi:hypothetical protein
MTPTGASLDRLLAALEDLLRQEAALIREGRLAALPGLQRRISPLIRAVERGNFGGEALRSRLEETVSLRNASASALAARCASNREGIQRINVTRQRISRLAPPMRRPRSVRLDVSV